MGYEVVVIGAGIQGAAVAQAASAQGYKVLLLEQYDRPAQGTSSRSSKLIHGGLRYLETGQFSLVRECLLERKRLLKNAPHLVHLEEFHIPIYEHTTRSRYIIAAGLMLYSLFSHKGFHRVPKSQWGTLDGLKTKGLKAVFSYFDAQTDDAKLTEAVLASAQSLGASIEYNAKFLACNIKGSDCCIRYEQNGESNAVSTRCMVNAAGPWVADIANLVEPKLSKAVVDLVQGTHIEIPGKAQRGMYYLEAPQDQRAVFVMPWKGHLLIGTTESRYQGDPAKVKPLDSEIDYLLSIYNHYFEQSLDRDKVLNAFAGLRVLPRSGSRAFSRPRDTVLVCDDKKAPHIVSLYGGKLTSHRATAEEVMEKLRRSLPSREPIADTRVLALPKIDLE